MNIDIKLNKDFERTLRGLIDEYGEDFEILNGIHSSQTNFSDFINAFVDKNVNDVTIDNNANASHKDIASLRAEKGKPQDKLIAANKIFYDMKKKYGLATAKDWLKTEYTGGFYLHDFPSTSFFSYCYKGENLLTVKYKNKEYTLSFIDLYELVQEPEKYDNSINQMAKFPQELYVLDLKDEAQVYTKVNRIVKHKNYKPLRVLKYSNGLSQIVTEDHPVILTNGEKSAIDVKVGDSAVSINTGNKFSNTLFEVTTDRENTFQPKASYGTFSLEKDLGWLVGFILAEGYITNYTIRLKQNKGNIYNKFINILNNYDIDYSFTDEYQTEFYLKSCSFVKWIQNNFGGQKSVNKRLPKDFINYNYEFLDGILAGFIDGDGTLTGEYKRNCQIRIVSETLLRQFSEYLQSKGIFVGDRTPYLFNYKNSFNSNFTVFGISFNISNDYFRNIGSIKIDNNYIPRKRAGDFKNKRYSCNYGNTQVISNTEYIDIVDEVYDITTETGHFICNNILSHNCYAYDLTRLAKEGLFFLDKYNNKPAKHLSVFIDDVIEYISFMSNRSSGAVGLPNILVWTYYFHKKDVEDFEEEFEKCGVTNEDLLTELITYRAKKDLRQNFQKLIYRLNQPFMRIDQSAFVNVSIFDQSYYEALFGDLVFPDGSFAIDYIDDFIDHQKIFMDVVSTIRKENMFTFPVLTYSLLFQEGKFVNEDFARWCSDHNLEWNDSNFFVGQDVTTLSNCPLKGNTKILYWSDFYQEFKLSTIKEVYFNLQKQDKDYIEVLQNGKKIKCKINKFNESADYQIALVNGATITTTENHLNKVLNKDYVKTKDLTIDDYLPISLIPYEETNNLSYEDGKLVGMFLGDGSYRNQSEITYSLNKETDKDDIEFIKEYAAKRYAAKFTEYYCTSHISGNNLCVNLSVNSKSLRGLIEQFVDGSDALTKAINLKALSCSKEFRKGIIDGIYTTDGSKNVDETSNRLYTSSESLKDTLVILCASLGIATTVSTDDREGRLGINPNYTIRFYTGRAKRKDVYIIDDNYFWVKIKDITRTKKTEVAYCLEVIDDNVPQEFMLGNGIITHNCRLLSDTSKLKGFFNSIGGTELSIGSVKVNTINLVHMFYELGDQLTETKYLNLLKKRVLLCCKTLDTVRHIITRNIEKGLLPNYCEGGVDLKHQYCTVGILGLYETVEKFGYIDTDEFGNKSYNDKGIAFAEKIFEVINEVKNSFTDEYSFNIESVPAERAAVNLCAKDSTLFNVRDYDIYSNQWIPLTAKCTISEKIGLSSVLDKLCSGGAIAHINLENNFANKDMAWDILNRIAQKGVFYFAFNTKINVCKARHAFIGTDICPECGQPVEDTWQRIVGFLTPTKSYSSARKKEFTARQWYDSGLIHGETSVMQD